MTNLIIDIESIVKLNCLNIECKYHSINLPYCNLKVVGLDKNGVCCYYKEIVKPQEIT